MGEVNLVRPVWLAFRTERNIGFSLLGTEHLLTNQVRLTSAKELRAG
jgi:hypothetical protein